MFFPPYGDVASSHGFEAVSCCMGVWHWLVAVARRGATRAKALGFFFSFGQMPTGCMLFFWSGKKVKLQVPYIIHHTSYIMNLQTHPFLLLNAWKVIFQPSFRSLVVVIAGGTLMI